MQDEIQEVDFARDRFEDVLARDGRYAANAYAYLMTVLGNLESESRPLPVHDILDEFRLFACEQYGSFAGAVMRGWGLKGFDDAREMLFNLIESKRLSRDDFDIPETYGYEYDFDSAFSDPPRPGGD